jgi:hypothetical protein
MPALAVFCLSFFSLSLSLSTHLSLSLFPHPPHLAMAPAGRLHGACTLVAATVALFLLAAPAALGANHQYSKGEKVEKAQR